MPRQSQPIATVTHAPAVAQALATHARPLPAAHRCSKGHAHGGGGGTGAGGHSDSPAALVVLVPPLHRWSMDPAEFDRLARSLILLLRGHGAAPLDRAARRVAANFEALQHCTNWARSPLRPFYPQSVLPPALLDARHRPLVVHALVTTIAPLRTLERLARPPLLPHVSSVDNNFSSHRLICPCSCRSATTPRSCSRAPS